MQSRGHRKVATTFRPPSTISRPDYLSAGSDEAFRETVYAMVLAFGRLVACRERFGRHLGLTGNQFAVLMGVAHRQGETGVSINDLARHVLLAPPHVTNEVGRLVRKGFLNKAANARDRRGVLVSLTPAGEAAVTEVAPLVREANDLLFSGIDRLDFDTVGRAMRQLGLNADAALNQLDARPPAVAAV